MPRQMPRRADAVVPANANEAAVLGFCTALMANDMDKFAAIWTEEYDDTFERLAIIVLACFAC